MRTSSYYIKHTKNRQTILKNALKGNRAFSNDMYDRSARNFVLLWLLHELVKSVPLNKLLKVKKKKVHFRLMRSVALYVHEDVCFSMSRTIEFAYVVTSLYMYIFNDYLHDRFQLY